MAKKNKAEAPTEPVLKPISELVCPGPVATEEPTKLTGRMTINEAKVSVPMGSVSVSFEPPFDVAVVSCIYFADPVFKRHLLEALDRAGKISPDQKKELLDIQTGR